jgi:hypothetical protein
MSTLDIPGMRDIELAASAQAVTDRAALEARPLEFGQYIAWALLQYTNRLTDGISAVHRVGVEGMTTCGEPIPPVPLWFPLNGALVETMPHCRLCETAYAHLRGKAA